MADPRWPYWGKFAALATASLGLLFAFIFGFLPQRFLVELDFKESGYAFPVVRPPLPTPPAPAQRIVRRPIPRGPAERLWAEYLPLARAGEHAAALGLLERYLTAHPEDADVAAERARALWRAGRPSAADVAYRRALALGEEPGLRRELARLRVADRRWDEALAVYTRLLERAPRDRRLLSEAAEAATWAERYARALALYERLLRLDPDDPELRFAYARTLYWAGRVERAADALAGVEPGARVPGVDSLRAAIERALPPEVAPAVNELERARALAMEGTVDSALALYRRLLSADPTADSLLLEMADVHQYRAEDPGTALAFLRAYLTAHPEAGAVRLRAARLLAWSGRSDAAEAQLRRLLERDPANADAWALLGDVERWRGERRSAARAYDRALALDGEHAAAREGRAALTAQVDALLARRGSIGPAGGFEYFGDSDDFRLARWGAGWTLGSPRARFGLDVAVERLSGRAPAGDEVGLTAAALQASAERWWLQGTVHGRAALGAWLPEDGTAVEPLVELSVAAPELAGGSYRVEYRHGPAYRETNTLETVATDLRTDALAVTHYRSPGDDWRLSAGARLTRFSGAGDDNLRGDASAGVHLRPGGGWTLGYETRALGFSGPAPRPGRRLYWDPEYFWSHSAVIGWRGAPADGWELELRAAPGLAWLRERDDDPALAGLLGLTAGVERSWDDWTLQGRAGFTQSRAGAYRSLGLELQLSRRFDLPGGAR